MSDYKVKEYATEKIKKTGETLHLELIKDLDILKSLGDQKDQQVLVGFAAESEDIEKNALEKLEEEESGSYLCQ